MKDQSQHTSAENICLYPCPSVIKNAQMPRSLTPQKNLGSRLSLLGSLFLLSQALIQADTISLNNGDFIKGQVSALHNNGTISLLSPLSPETITLKANTLNQITFDAPDPSPLPDLKDTPDSPKPNKETARELLTLINGDTLTTTFTAVGENTLTVQHPSLGELIIPRHHIRHIQFGHTARKLIYQGPTPLDKDWKEVRGISFQDGIYSSGERGQACLPDIFPRNFSVDFTLRWHQDQTPKIRLHLCPEKTSAYANGDWYYLSISEAGISLNKKSTSNRQRYQKLSSNNFRPEDFPDNQMKVSLRFNRDKKLIHLYINGQLADSIFALPSIPKSNNFIIESLAGGESYNEITRLRITDWNTTKPTQALTDQAQRDNPALDAFLDTEGSLYTGQLLELVSSELHPLQKPSLQGSPPRRPSTPQPSLSRPKRNRISRAKAAL